MRPRGSHLVCAEAVRHSRHAVAEQCTRASAVCHAADCLVGARRENEAALFTDIEAAHYAMSREARNLFMRWGWLTDRRVVSSGGPLQE